MNYPIDIKSGLVCLAFIAGILPSLTYSADVPVSYNVDPHALRSATAGSFISFELYADSACSTPVANTSIDIADPALLIKKITLSRVNGGPKVANISTLEYVMTGVSLTENLYLRVVGGNITPVGGDCQIQQRSAVSVSRPASPPQCVSTAVQSFAIQANSSRFFDNPACPAGYIATTPYCWTASTGVYNQGSGYNNNVNSNQTFCSWRNTTATQQTVFGGNMCCRVPASP